MSSRGFHRANPALRDGNADSIAVTVLAMENDVSLGTLYDPSVKSWFG
jgi:hypothetical protein